MTRSDVQLMLDVKAGDEQSFGLLLQRYRTPLVNFLYRMVRSREQAEDLAQEVFIRVYRAREEYVPSAKFTTWLFRIATNLALNSLRDHRHQKLEISMDAPVTADAEHGDEKPFEVADKHPTIEQKLVEEDRKKMIRHAIENGGLDRLAEITRAVASLGGLAYTARLAQSEADQALAALAPLPETAFKNGLSELAKFALARKN